MNKNTFFHEDIEYPWSVTHDYNTGWEYEIVRTICPLPNGDFAIIQFDSMGGYEFISEVPASEVKTFDEMNHENEEIEIRHQNNCKR